MFCRWLHEKLLLNVVTRESTMTTACFAPLNTLRDIPINSKQLQSFRKDMWILLILRISSFLAIFEGRGWDKLLGELLGVCEPLIWEFYAKASLKKDHIECWVRGRAFTLDMGDIDAILGLEEQDHEGFIPFKDKMVSLKSVQLHIVGYREGRCLNTTSFPPDLRCLAYIMMFNLYSVRKLSTINIARAIFLMELCKKIYIDIGAHLYNITVEATKTTSRSKLVLRSLIMRILHENGVETPRHISLMTSSPYINSQTILRSRVWLTEDEQAEELEETPPVDTEIEAEGQQPPPRRGGGCGRRGASSSSSVPLDAFQIILERIDGLRDVATKHSNNLATI